MLSRRRRYLVLVGLLMIVGSAFVPAAEARRVHTGSVVSARIEATLWTPWVSVMTFAPGESVTVSYDVTNDGSFEVVQTQTTDSNGDANVNLGSFIVRSGARIVATSATYSRTLIVAAVRIEYANAQSNVVSGVAPASASVRLMLTQAGPPLAQVVTSADGSGSWTYDFTGVYDFAPGQDMVADVLDASGNVSRAWWEAVVPRVSAGYSQYGANSVFVSDFSPGTSVRVRVDYGNDGGPLGGFDFDLTKVVDTRFGTMFDLGAFDVLRPGDHLVATGGGWTKDLVTVPLRIEKADPVHDIVSGIANASTSVTVNVDPVGGGGPAEQSLTVTSDSTGFWSADFSSLVDFGDGRHVNAFVSDADGDQTGTSWFAVVPHLGVNTTAGPPSQVSLTMFAPGTSVRVRVDYGNNSSVDFDQTVVVSSMFGTAVNLGGSGLLHAGDYVIVEGGGWTKTLVAASVAVTSVSFATDTATGTAAPGSQVVVSLSVPPGSPGGPPVATLTVTADAGGLWVADFSSLSDIVVNQQVNAEITDADGDVTQASGWATEVVWPKNGFEAPISNPPTVNTRKAGSVVPVRFSLGGYHGLDVIAAGFPVSSLIDCSANPTLTTGTQISMPGRDALTYNSFTGVYELRWSTLKAWKGTCRQLVVKFADGTYLRANFRFN